MPAPFFYDIDEDGVYESVVVGASILGGDTPFTGTGLLAIIEFEIIFTPTTGETVSTSLDIDNPETFMIDSGGVDISFKLLNGSYAYTFLAAGESLVTINVNATEVVFGRDVEIYGAVYPVRVGVDVTVYYRLNATGEEWRVLGTNQTDSASRYRFVWTTDQVGIFELKSGWPGDENTFGSESPIVTVIVKEAVPSETLVMVIPSQLTVGQPNVTLPTPPFTINLTVSDVTDLFAWETKVYYDPDILNFSSAQYPSDHVFSGRDFVSVNATPRQRFYTMENSTVIDLKSPLYTEWTYRERIIPKKANLTEWVDSDNSGDLSATDVVFLEGPNDIFIVGRVEFGATTLMSVRIGHVKYGAGLLGFSGVDIVGTGTLAQLTFIGVGPGTSFLNFSRPLGEDTFLWNSNLESIPFEAFDGKVTVLGEKIPSTIFLDVYPEKVMVGDPVTISGFIDPQRPGVTVTIYYRLFNRTWAILTQVKTDSTSNYFYIWTPTRAGVYELKSSWPGDANTQGDESDIKTVTVVERPPPGYHDLSVSLDAPEYVPFGNPAWINATVQNLGTVTETNVEIWLFINGTLADYATNLTLASGSSYTLKYLWNASNQAIYNITAYVPIVPGESSFPPNNIAINFATVSTTEPTPLIHPSEGQWANYTLTALDPYGTNHTIIWSLNYTKYVSPYLINVTLVMQDPVTGEYMMGWMTIDIIHRWVESGASGQFWYFGWIETDVNLGSNIQLLDGPHTVTGSRIIEAIGLEIDSWEIQFTIYYSPPYYANYTFWYDKATGLWIGADIISYDGVRMHIMLAATNIQIGQLLKIQTDKPMYLPDEMATLTATYRIGDMPVENATILAGVYYPNGTEYFIWTTTTDSNGTATTSFLIPEDAPFGEYTIYATAYKDMTNATATTTFMVVRYAPQIKLWFEGPDITLVNQETTMILHITNVGNLTAYNVNATFTLPSDGDLQILTANTTFTGLLDPGAEVRLAATVRASKPYRYVFLGEAVYTKEDGTPMPLVSAEKTLIYAYHLEYPVDLIDMTVFVSSQAITVNLTIINYGDSPVEVTLIASAQHIATKLMLRSTYQKVTINPGETVTISLTITIPTNAPTGEYQVQGILATGLPREGGFALAYQEQTTQV